MQSRKFPPMNLNDQIKFGKHYGKTIQWIIENDAQYIDWLLAKKKGFDIDEQADKFLQSYLED